MKVREAFISGFLIAGACAAQGRIELTEYPVPGFPGGVVGGPDGAVWFTLVLSNRIGRITPDGSVSTFGVGGSSSFSLMGEITLGPDGALWYVRFQRSFNLTRIERIWIGRLTTAGEFVEFQIPLSAGTIPGLAAGPDNAVWFTEGQGGRIGRITPNGQLTEFPLPRPNSQPVSIVRGPDDALWFTESSAIGRITTSGVLTEFPLQDGARPIDITTGGDGALWFTESSSPEIGRITPSGEISRFSLPAPGDRAGGIVWGNDGALWLTESGNKIARMETDGTFVEVGLAMPNSSAFAITVGPDGAVWFSEQLASRIGRVIFNRDAARTCTVDRTTLCLHNGRFEVTTHWETATAFGRGVAVPLTSDTGYFWFFSANNVEVVVKALDGCSLNDRYWLFAAGLTDVGVYTVVADTQSGLVRTYANPRQTPFAPVTDTDAFRTCH